MLEGNIADDDERGKIHDTVTTNLKSNENDLGTNMEHKANMKNIH